MKFAKTHESFRQILFLLLLSLAVIGYASLVEASGIQDESAQSIESQLDDYLNQSAADDFDGKAFLQPVINRLTSSTPLATRVRAWTYWASEFAYDEQFDKANGVLEQIGKEVQRSDDANLKAELLANKIDLLVMDGKLDKAFIKVPDLEAMMPQVQSPRINYYAYNLLSQLYTEWSRYEIALGYLIKAQSALDHMQGINQLRRRLFLKSSIADIQLRLEQWDLALETSQAALDEIGDNSFPALSYELWFTQYYAYTSLGNYELGLSALQRAYQYTENYPFQRAIVLNNFGDSYMRLNQLNEAKSHLNEALELAQSLDYEDMVRTVEFNLGFIAVRQGDSLGLQQMKRVVDYFRETEQLSALEQTLKELAQAYEIMERYKEQASALKERQSIREKILQNSQNKALAEMQALYDNRDKAQRIDLLEQKNKLSEQIIENNRQQTIITWLAIILGGFVFLALLLLYRKVKESNRKLKQANFALSEQTKRDPLTGLENRRSMQLTMEARKQKNVTAPIGLVLLDIDNFKRINDTYGHHTGDEVLVEMSRRLRELCREDDSLVRWGGEEFLFCLNRVNQQQLIELVRRIQQAVSSAPVKTGKKDISVTATIGFITLPFSHFDEAELDWESALKLADLALYSGKARGRHCAVGVMGLTEQGHVHMDDLIENSDAAIEENWLVLELVEEG
ncbi:diguanylate cyclase (GGDEF)-like protein [Idiomarina fontislapidosi]|uniref:diguanylate cyclase n=1 Tax=Idiomarina fontislapidosi TaxID=263723 RepID=A0A432Y816_9GAMM|nr:tetratricopeptide repeat-containing diguanylate cyclase [Idiomarina fontislapidosi]PYE32390.1 diguanylate cyclase (GGDEF)-like protein [Idiomarina fontislapidosi]RUO57093.1 hypothetical protein CWE25_05310 [Idiomarina fontislapidosi]